MLGVIKIAIKDRVSKKEKLIQKTMNVDDELYSRLERLSKSKYSESVSKLINACVCELVETEKINIYESENEFLVKHTIIFRQSVLKELERLRRKYRISIYKLVNIAIHNVIDELEQ